jgi:multiple sugar transport system permease protein
MPPALGAPPVATGGTPVSRRAVLENIEGWLFALPWVIGLLVFYLGPMLASVYFSFTRYNAVTPPVWVGLDNYVELLARDPLTWHSLWVTTVFAFLSVPLNLFLGLGVAILLNQEVRGLAAWRTLYYLPSVISGVAVALLWQWMFNTRFGVINHLLKLWFGIEGPDWLGNASVVMPAFILMSLWAVGGSMLINLAALQGVPTALYEAARIDGAHAGQLFRHITLPMISPVIFFNLIMGIIAALQSFTNFYILTDGGPNNATLTFMLYLYRRAFQHLQMGYGAAMAWLLFIYLAALTALVFRSSRAWVYYEAPGGR